MDESIRPGGGFVDGLVESVGAAVRRRGIAYTAGGGICAGTLDRYRERPGPAAGIDCLETRKVVLPAEAMLREPDARDEALRLEGLRIRSKKEIGDAMLEAELARLEKPRARGGSGYPRKEAASLALTSLA